jgi:hypothetical protein
VFLSMPQPREVAYRRLDAWLDDYLGAAANVDTAPQNR